MGKAVFVVDMLKDFMPESIYSEAALPVEPAKQVIEPIKEFIEEAREEDVPVFYLNDSHWEEDPEFEEWGEHCVKGTEGAEVIEELKPEEEDIVIEKPKYSGFSNSRLKKDLEERDIDEVYIIGVVTHVCVLETAKDALKNGLETYVVKECVSGTNSRKHGLEKVKENGIDLISREEIEGMKIGKRLSPEFEERIKLFLKDELSEPVLENQRGKISWDLSKKHVKTVVDRAKWLCGFYPEADEEVVETAAWLHDCIHPTGGYEGGDHNIASAEAAEKFLESEGMAKDKVRKVKKCIKSHRSSCSPEPDSIEARIVASADNLAHFINFDQIQQDMGFEKAFGKVKRDLNKDFMLPEAMEYAEKKMKEIKSSK